MKIALVFTALAMLAMPSWAEEMHLDAAGIAAALTDRTLVYDDGATQIFHADGSTTYENGKPSAGRWALRGDRYCSVWPPSDLWACYDVVQSADGQSLTFVADSDERTTGHYAP